MKIEDIFQEIFEGRVYKGASGMKIYNMLDRNAPMNKKMLKLKKGVYGVDAAGGGGGE